MVKFEIIEKKDFSKFEHTYDIFLVRSESNKREFLGNMYSKNAAENLIKDLEELYND